MLLVVRVDSHAVSLSLSLHGIGRSATRPQKGNCCCLLCMSTLHWATHLPPPLFSLQYALSPFNCAKIIALFCTWMVFTVWLSLMPAPLAASPSQPRVCVGVWVLVWVPHKSAINVDKTCLSDTFFAPARLIAQSEDWARLAAGKALVVTDCGCKGACRCHLPICLALW